MPERYGHKNVVQEGDEYVCRACGCRWDAQDERVNEVPECNVAAARQDVTKHWLRRENRQARR